MLGWTILYNVFNMRVDIDTPQSTESRYNIFVCAMLIQRDNTEHDIHNSMKNILQLDTSIFSTCVGIPTITPMI